MRRSIPCLIPSASRAMRTILRMLLFSFRYRCVFVVLCLTGLLTLSRFTPSIYTVDAPLGQRISNKGMPTTDIPRVYHSVASLTPQGYVDMLPEVFLKLLHIAHLPIHTPETSSLLAQTRTATQSMGRASSTRTFFTRINCFQFSEYLLSSEFRVEYLNPPYMAVERPTLNNLPTKIGFNQVVNIPVTIPKNLKTNSIKGECLAFSLFAVVLDPPRALSATGTEQCPAIRDPSCFSERYTRLNLSICNFLSTNLILT